MIAAFTKWKSDRAERRKMELYIAGYDWAAGMLLRGIEECEVYTYIDDPFEHGEFDYGAQDAMLDFSSLKQEVQS